MKSKILNVCLIITSLFGYLEWGAGNHAFLFQAEVEILNNLIRDPRAMLHPFTLLPLFGQILLLITLFQKTPDKRLTFSGLAGIGILLVFMFIIGVLSLNMKILVSTLPFIAVAILTLRHYTKQISGEKS